MQSRALMILAIIFNISHKIDAKLIVIPSVTEVKINDSTYINCSTSLQADLIQWKHGTDYVHTGLQFLEPYNDDRFSVEINTSTGACNLVIRSIQPSDAGRYECLEDEGFGEKISAQLIVLDDDPVCKSNMHSDGVIGPNSCSIEPDEIKLSCSITYHGSVSPVLRWKKSEGNESSADGLVTVSYINNEVTYTLHLKGSLDLNNSSYVCETTRASDKHYSCSSNTINILYVFSSDLPINMTVDEEVSCLANTSQSCSYKWKWFSGDDVTTESANQILRPKKDGLHRCEANCSLANRSCTVNVMSAVVKSTELVSMQANVLSDAAISRKNLLVVVLVLLVLPVVIGVICYIRKRKIKSQTRKSEGENEEQGQGTDAQENELQGLLDGLPLNYKLDLVLRETIQTKPAKMKKKSIFGLTILDNELFAVSERSSKVEVYDSIELTFKREFILELIDPWDIESCKINKCLYIFDFKGDEKLNEILRFDPNGNLLKRWSTEYDSGWGLSVTAESNVILTVSDKHTFIEYSPDGQVIRETNLSSVDNIRCPRHVVKLTSGDFVVSHYVNDLHRVCLVDKDGKLMKKSFGGKCGSTLELMNEPRHLSVDENGFVMVVDGKNSRVLLLDSELELKGEILSKGRHKLQNPMRILLDESNNNRLFVAENEWGCDGRILVFDFSA